MPLRCALCKSSAPGTCAGAERPCVPADDERLTEAEYVAWVNGRAEKMAAGLTAALPDWAQAAGLRFEMVRAPAIFHPAGLDIKYAPACPQGDSGEPPEGMYMIES